MSNSGGTPTVQGSAADNAAPGNPILVGLNDSAGGVIRSWRTISSRVDGDNGVSYGPVHPMLFNGATYDRTRTPNIFKTLNAVVVTAETTIWTPAAGKKFRLMGLVVAVSAAAGGIFLKDNTAGTTIAIVPALAVNIVVPMTLDNGILSAAANNVLTAQGSAGEAITGVVFGTEE